MPKLNVLNIQGQNVGEIELSDAVFGVEVNEHVLYEVVKNQLANKVRRLAMKSALTSKVQTNEMIVLDALTMEAPKTKEFATILKNVNAAKKALVVMAEKNENVIKSAANIPNVETALVNTINVYDILKYDSFIITTDAVKKVEEVYA